VLFHFFVPDPEIFPQLEGLTLEADDELIYVLDIDANTATDNSNHPMVSILITDAFIGEEVKPKKKHHQAYTPMGEKKPGVVYKRKYRKAEDRIQPIATQLPEEFCIVRNIIRDPLENMLVLPTHPPNFVPGLRYMQEVATQSRWFPVARRGEAGTSPGKRAGRMPIMD
jgi:hypothetical protein